MEDWTLKTTKKFHQLGLENKVFIVLVCLASTCTHTDMLECGPYAYSIELGIPTGTLLDYYRPVKTPTVLPLDFVSLFFAASTATGQHIHRAEYLVTKGLHWKYAKWLFKLHCEFINSK